MLLQYKVEPGYDGLYILVLRDRVGTWLPIRWLCVRALPQDVYVVHCWLISPNKLNLPS